MKYFCPVLLAFSLFACKENAKQSPHNKPKPVVANKVAARPAIAYDFFIADCKKKVVQLRSSHQPEALQTFVFNTIAEKMPVYWNGTTWDFNGISRNAGEGSIACGYFITTILEDIGLKINRIKMAQAPSSVLIKATCSNIKTYSTVSQLQQHLTTVAPNTILLVGLDFHTGFIIKQQNNSYFFHSNYISKQGVVKETIESSTALKSSKSFMVGVLSRNDDYLFK